MDGMRTGMERMVGADRGLGEESLQGQGTPTGRSFRLVRACVRAVLFISNRHKMLVF